ncbi:hypothetical protein IWX65_003508 [Arthrobacter sp. CAN_A214]
MLLVAQMCGDLAFQSGLQNELGQLRQQPALAVHGQPLPLSLTHQLRYQRLVHLKRPLGPC